LVENHPSANSSTICKLLKIIQQILQEIRV
jgi:hypothetical protein